MNELIESLNEYSAIIIEQSNEGISFIDKLIEILKKSDKKDVIEALENISQEYHEREIISSLAKENIPFDRNELLTFRRRLDDKIRDLEQHIYIYAGEPFNINSPKQVGKILFEKLDLPHGNYSKYGFSTNAEILERIKDQDPLVELIIQYRKLVKLDSYAAKLLYKLSHKSILN